MADKKDKEIKTIIDHIGRTVVGVVVKEDTGDKLAADPAKFKAPPLSLFSICTTNPLPLFAPSVSAEVVSIEAVKKLLKLLLLFIVFINDIANADPEICEPPL